MLSPADEPARRFANEPPARNAEANPADRAGRHNAGMTDSGAAPSGSQDGSPASAALSRVLAAIGGVEVAQRLAGLSGSDFTTVMLDVARRRAAAETPASVLRRYRGDRLVQPGSAPWRRLRRAEDLLAAALPTEFELMTLAPLVPLGTHSALGPVSQDWVVTAMRACEVAADPTNALALEAAARRIARRDTPVRLAAFQRVVRAQALAAGYLAHFSLLGLVTAGRDDGGHRFEREAVAEHVRAIAAGLRSAGFAGIQLALTPLTPAGEAIAAAVGTLLGDDPAPVEVVLDAGREAGRGYYRELCFKINVQAAEAWAEVGDGGFTDWAARLMASDKERLVISGLGIDRMAALAPWEY
jgi:hypothetical protein